MRFILILGLFLSTLNCCSQGDFSNLTAPRKDSSFIFAQTANRFAIKGDKNAHWQLKGKIAQIKTTDDPLLFNVESSRLGPDTLSLSRNGKIVLTKIFYVIPEPNIVAHWGALQSDTATTVEVIANRKMALLLQGFNFPPKCRVVGFNINFVTNQFPPEGKKTEINGNTLTQEAADLIAKLKHGDKIVFSEIKVVANECRPRILPGFTIVIK